MVRLALSFAGGGNDRPSVADMRDCLRDGANGKDGRD